MNDEEVKKLEKELKECFDCANKILWRLFELNAEYYADQVSDMPITRIWADPEKKKIYLLPF